MKPRLVLALLFLSVAPLLHAQEKSLLVPAPVDLASAELLTASAAKFPSAPTPDSLASASPGAVGPDNLWLWSMEAPESASSRASSSAPPQTRSRNGSDSRHRLETAVGYSFVKFRSVPITASMNGVNSSIAYYLNNHFAAEGNVTAAFGSKIFDREHTKFLSYTAGAKYSEPRGAWEPWAHILAGGVHMLPQAADGSKNGLAVKAGGGIDYNWPRESGLWIRVEGDYIRTQLYSAGQNNFMISVGLVYHIIDP
jgi:hypothetical protein